MKPATFKKVMGRYPERQGQFPVTPVRPKPLDPGALFHYWHPDREGVEQAPADFATKLAAISPEVRCVRPPAGAPIRSRCWLVWYRKAEVRHPMSPGWLLVLAWHAPDGSPLPLDNRVLANLHLQSLQGGREIFGRDFRSAAEYFSHIESVMARDQAAREKVHTDDLADRTHDYAQFRKIKNIGHGSKFALHHDGTLYPSRGEANWVRERQDDMLPAAVMKQHREETRQVSSARPNIAQVDQTAILRRESDATLRELQTRALIRSLAKDRRRESVFVSRKA